MLRLLLLIGSGWLLAYLWWIQSWYISSAVLLGLMVIQWVALFQKIHKTNQDIARLFESIQHHDFSLHFSEQAEGVGFEELHSALNQIIASYRQVRVEKEQHFQHLEQLVEYLHTGILSIQQDGKIGLMNSAAMELLALPRFHEYKILKSRRPEWVEQVESLPYHEQRSIAFHLDGSSKLQLVYKGRIRLGENEHTIISFQGIQDEVEQHEIRAYHKLIRILTHEIMNTVTPIASLSETLQQWIQSANDSPVEWTEDSVKDLQQGLDTIHRRSQGLLRFVEDYRKLTRIPQARPTWQALDEWWERLTPLLESMGRDAGVPIELSIQSRNKKAHFDAALLEQVVINLVKNALEAVDNTSEAKVGVHLNAHGDRWKIRVRDNGPGVADEKIHQLFVPFYSTKPQGSGIGLSLSKSIMQGHRGSLRYVKGHEGALLECELPIAPHF